MTNTAEVVNIEDEKQVDEKARQIRQLEFEQAGKDLV